MIGTGSGNVIEGNSVLGNTNGILLTTGTRNTTVRDNTVLGNPNIQAGATFPTARAADIVNLSPDGEAMFEGNVCLTSVNAPCPAVTGPRPKQ